MAIHSTRARHELDHTAPAARVPLHAIELHETELLRAAYLLTGDATRAVDLAEAACLTQLPRLLSLPDGEDGRDNLLQALARCYLHAAPAGSRPGTIGVPGEGARFRVDDERARMWAALDRCERPVRLALVLRDLCRLAEEDVAALVQQPPHALRDRLNAVRERLRDAVGARSDQTARTLLLTLALGAPHVDLRRRLDAPAGLLLARRRQRRVLLGAGSALAAVVAVLAVAFGLFSGGDARRAGAPPPPRDVEAAMLFPIQIPTPVQPTPPALTLARPAAHIPDVQLFGIAEEAGDAPPQATTLLYEPESAGWTALPDVGSGLRLSPDGRWLSFVTFPDHRPGGVTTLGVIETASQTERWSRASPHLDGRPVFAQGRLFAVFFERDTGQAPELVAFAPEDGRELGRWELPTGALTPSWSGVRTPQLFAAIDESRLYVIYEQTEERSDSGQRVVLTYNLPELVLEQAAAQEIRLERGFLRPVIDLAGARPTPDGRGLYSMSYEPSAPGLRFLDFATAAFLSVELPFDTPGPQTIPDLRAVLAHDGEELYVVSGSGDVAIVDLRARRVARHFQLDPGGYQLTPSNATQWFYWLDYGLLSPNGEQLYLVNIWTPQAAPNDRAAVSTLWTIDVTQWRVSARWEVEGSIEALSLSADGARLYAATAAFTGRTRRAATFAYQLVEIDAATGSQHSLNAALGLPASPLALSTNSLQQLYRQQYGITPPTADTLPGEPAETSSLPRLELRTPVLATPAGSPLTIEVQLLDPGHGRPLSRGTPGVRFAPGAAVSVLLAHPSGEQLIVIPYPVDDVTHRATVHLAQPGAWRATVSVTQPDGTVWSRSWPDVVQVSPALQAGDGQRYIFDVTALPENPFAGQAVVFQAQLIDIRSGDPLPVRTQLSNGAPEVLTLVLYRPDGTLTSLTLRPVWHGVYEAQSVILTAGNWRAELSFRPPGGLPVKLSAGTLTVAAEPR